MYTVLVITMGFALLAICALVGRGLEASPATASLIFLPLWLLGAGINMYLGIKRAGYSVGDEFPIFLVVFAIPAAGGRVVGWKFH